ncbi:DNA repair protein RecN, partial [candidate division KSB1 bacterium]
MLLNLHIENYTLIHQLDISFDAGFSVITGETGAGKSILIGALSLILGQRADNQSLFNKEKKCVIEGTFEIRNYGLKSFFSESDLDYDDQTIIRREINQLGKSRAFINDTPVNLNLLKEFGYRLVDVHSQHNTITLNDSNFQLAVIDSFVKHNKIVEAYRNQFVAYKKKKSLLNELISTEEQYKSEQDYLQFLLNELTDARLTIDEQGKIEEDIKILSHAEEIKNTLYGASHMLIHDEINLLNNLNEIISQLQKLASFHPKINDFADRLTSNYIDLKDIAEEMEQIEQQVQYDPDQLENLNNRLDLIFRLQQKHHVSSIKELLDKQSELNSKLNEINSLEDKINHLKSELDNDLQTIIKSADEISLKRKASIPDIETELEKRLSSLGMPDARFKILLQTNNELSSDGKDTVKFMFNANKGGELMELSRVASGGELSRLMLSVKSLISQRNLLPTIIFDEIDIGVSGEIAGKVGNIMQKMTDSMQVIAITHLPQIAGKSDHHYFVFKTSENNITQSVIKKLSNEERINEIAKMLSDDR